MGNPGEVPARRRRLTGEEKGLLVVLALVLVAVGVFELRPHVQDVLRQRAVIRACQNAVAAQLKAPATASFPRPAGWRPPSQGLVPLPTGVKVHGWSYAVVVDAQNSFGATIRATFQCSDAGIFGVTVAQQ